MCLVVDEGVEEAEKIVDELHEEDHPDPTHAGLNLEVHRFQGLGLGRLGQPVTFDSGGGFLKWSQVLWFTLDDKDTSRVNEGHKVS